MISRRETFRIEVPYYVEAYVTLGPGHYSRQRVLDISGTGLSFISGRKINTGEKRKIQLHFPFIFDSLSLEIEVARVSVNKQPSVGGKKPGKKWDLSCRYVNQSIARESAIFRFVRFLERREIAYRRNGLHRVDIPEDLRLFLAYGEEWYRIKHKVKNLSENGLLFESYSRLEPGTGKTAYLGFPWSNELQRLSIGVVRVSDNIMKFEQSDRAAYDVGCRLENLHQQTQEKLHDEINHMQKYGVSPKKRVRSAVRALRTDN
ncbi:MAG: PilZ domain-containing protein [Nitrospinota bacterium]